MHGEVLSGHVTSRLLNLGRIGLRISRGLSLGLRLRLGLRRRHRLAKAFSLRPGRRLSLGLHGGYGLPISCGLCARYRLPMDRGLCVGYGLPVGLGLHLGLRNGHWLPLRHRRYRLRGRHRLETTPVVLRNRLSRLRGLALHRSHRLNWLTGWIKARLRYSLRTWLNTCLFGLPICRFSS